MPSLPSGRNTSTGTDPTEAAWLIRDISARAVSKRSLQTWSSKPACSCCPPSTTDPSWLRHRPIASALASVVPIAPRPLPHCAAIWSADLRRSNHSPYIEDTHASKSGWSEVHRQVSARSTPMPVSPYCHKPVDRRPSDGGDPARWSDSRGERCARPTHTGKCLQIRFRHEHSRRRHARLQSRTARPWQPDRGIRLIRCRRRTSLDRGRSEWDLRQDGPYRGELSSRLRRQGESCAPGHSGTRTPGRRLYRTGQGCRVAIHGCGGYPFRRKNRPEGEHCLSRPRGGGLRLQWPEKPDHRVATLLSESSPCASRRTPCRRRCPRRAGATSIRGPACKSHLPVP